MLHFSAKGEYAVLAVLALSLHTDPGPLQVKAIAQKEKIPLRFLEQVMSQLKKKGLVESVRGPHGGYRLARLPGQITFGEVLRAIEGQNAPSELSYNKPGERGIDSMILREIWHEANDVLQNQLNAINFQDLCERKIEREGGNVLMFHI
ncbi:MAG: RrF2 family transcriptional regulator [Nitrospiria bacterium]